MIFSTIDPLLSQSSRIVLCLLSVMALAGCLGDSGGGDDASTTPEGSGDTAEGGSGDTAEGGSGDTASQPPLFEGFEDLAFSDGTYWEYTWTYDQTSNGSAQSTESGTVRISLGNPTDVNFPELGGLITVYEVEMEARGDTYPLPWNWYPYLGVRDGALYVASYDGIQWGAAVLFDPRDGSVYQNGFVGYFSGSRDETVYWGTLDGRQVVVVDEPYYDPACEYIEGIEICDEEYHDYDVREYFLPGIGFGGFYRSGSSVFSGGGYSDTFTSTMRVTLAASSLQ
jgi:hypothetical protein